MLADTVVNHMIRVWRIARLSRELAALGYPSTNLIARCVEMGGTDGIFSGSFRSKTPPGPAGITDAERVQSIVNRMPRELRVVFEAYHLGLIRGDSCRKTPHKARALILGISPSTYFKRRKYAHTFLRGWLEMVLDDADQFDQTVAS